LTFLIKNRKLDPGTALSPALEAELRRHPGAAVLFSGGVDSSFLLAAAARVLGPGVTAITFTGPHTVSGELAAAWALTRRLQVPHVVRVINPLDLPEFRGNTRERCYACKRAVILQARRIAAARGLAVLWDGTNRDDLREFRPGFRALQELGVASPLLAAGLDKQAIRTESRGLGLDGARPSQSCLATRFPYDTPLTREALARVGRGESWLLRRAFAQVRLRVRGERVRLELPPQEWPAFLAPGISGPYRAFIRSLGFADLTLDCPK